MRPHQELRGHSNDRASFPVIGIREGKKGNNLTRFEKAVIGIPGAAVRIIDALQPYQAGNDYKSTKLWRLHRLWNVDKHRRIPLHGRGVDVRAIYPLDLGPIMNEPNDGRTMRFPLAAKGKIPLEPAPKLKIVFGDASQGVEISYEELIDLHNFLGVEVLSRFDCFF